MRSRLFLTIITLSVCFFSFAQETDYSAMSRKEKKALIRQYKDSIKFTTNKVTSKTNTIEAWKGNLSFLTAVNLIQKNELKSKQAFYDKRLKNNSISKENYELASTIIEKKIHKIDSIMNNINGLTSKMEKQRDSIGQRIEYFKGQIKTIKKS